MGDLAPGRFAATGGAYYLVMVPNGRYAVMFSITAHEDTPACEVDQQALEHWERTFAVSNCTGRVRIPRPVAALPDPQRPRHIEHRYEGVMWD
ncbi:hypothetical protein [Rhodococcus sp. GA1]|uniref:hypothetical protein n=1 Tax=Rhodococcus sp. GA1 TaxID=2942275 RepID=UPI0020CE7A17|nr:hypothetical protein [Rhodococcus sp. GA1]